MWQIPRRRCVPYPQVVLFAAAARQVMQSTTFPRLPEMGRRETYYANLARRAQEANDPHLRAAAKVCQYITIANNPALDWPTKLTHYQHTLNRHCQPPL